jgi:hypothetical protein
MPSNYVKFDGIFMKIGAKKRFILRGVPIQVDVHQWQSKHV